MNWNPQEQRYIRVRIWEGELKRLLEVLKKNLKERGPAAIGFWEEDIRLYYRLKRAQSRLNGKSHD